MVLTSRPHGSSSLLSSRLPRRSILAAGALAAPLGALGLSSGTARAADASFGLTPVEGSPWHDPDQRSVDFRFQAEGIQVFNPSVRVTLPESYDSSPDRRYPVLLLLHGGFGMYLSWSGPEHGNAIELTRGHDLIVVMPDGGGGSFYSNANHPLPGREAAWETFIMDRVLPFVHANFRTDPARMAIAGFSMGGWGALALGQRYWGHFRSISSYSGPSDCNPATVDGLGVAAIIWAGPAADYMNYPATANPPGSTWGGELYPEIAKGYNPMDNIEKYRGKRLFLRAGTGDILSAFAPLSGDQSLLLDELRRNGENAWNSAQEAVVHATNDRFSAALDAAGIEHDYVYHPGRTHEWGLWRDSLEEDLPGMMACLEA